MDSYSHTVAARLGHIVDWFIPPTMANDKNQRKLARLFLISHLCGPFLGNTVPISLWIVSPTPGWDIVVLAASITGFWVFPPLLKMKVRYDLLAMLSIENLIFCILWSCYFNGAVTSPTLSWVLTIPLLAFFYIGNSRKLRNAVLIQFFANLAVFGVTYYVLPPPDNGIPLADIQVLGLISTCASALYVSMMAVYYARALASQSEIEQEMRRHLDTASDLRRAAADAERASTAKSEFLAKMSHELRTPLNAVIGYSQMLLEEAEDTGDHSNSSDFRKILSSGQHLLRLVNNVLDLSKLEAGHVEFFNETFAVKKLLTSVVDGLETLAQEHRNRIGLHLEGSPELMIGDMPKIQCVLLNVIENAVKFTRDGHVDVIVRRIDGPDGDAVAFEVVDDGPGIPAGELPWLFEQFSVGDDLTNAKYGGTGIGLALTQKLCHLMGGSVSVETEVGKGSRFTIVLPAGRAAPAVTPVGQLAGAQRYSKSIDDDAESDTPVMAMVANG
ncbi:HAMP domain-containing histidine kinase [Siculibacillus lacustris]|uniref:histidine kinase n=1 Tax=Siculibacillus lacustris TaxID=1549641 RepID=A0A4Q9VM69_9HYPH|nr:HAMP domain-containing sensor histidine kinase [Siculibacillus lacustris]TBW36117.1 HAMP domain-containing histidine kinase [Siculibacillus lacustris]